MGTVGNGKDVGLFIHPMLAIDAQEETCLGIAALKAWTRTVKSNEDYPKLPIEEKESFRWLETAEQAKNTLSEASCITVVADRKSDIYEEWDIIPDKNTHILTRACRDKRLTSGTKLYGHVEQLSVSGMYEFNVDKRTGKRSAHTAKLEVRFGEIEIQRPKNCSDKKASKSIKLRVVDVREIA